MLLDEAQTLIIYGVDLQFFKWVQRRKIKRVNQVLFLEEQLLHVPQMQFLGRLVQPTLVKDGFGAGKSEQTGVPAIFERHAVQLSISML